MGDVSVKLIQPLARQFPLPKGAASDPEAWEKDYIAELDFYTDTVLEFAAKRLIANKETRSFPMVAECLKACRETHNEFAKPAPRAKDSLDEWSPEAIAAADRLLCCELGRRAADENWHWQLWDWLRKHRRWPNRIEADQIKAHSAAMIAETGAFVKSEEKAQRLNSATKVLLGKMSKRRKELRELAYGNSADKHEDVA